VSPDRPRAGQLEQRSEPITVDGRRLRSRIPYGVESRDMGGWTEVVDRGALDATVLDDLVATVDHVGVPIGRHPTTLTLEDRDDGLHWAVDPPRSRADVLEAVERGDLRAGSWRMRVGRDRWEGDVRHIEAIAELRDVAIVTTPAYPSAAVELRNHQPAEGQEDRMSTDAQPAVAPATTSTPVQAQQGAQDATPATPAPTGTNPSTVTPAGGGGASTPAGGLNVDDRVAVTPTRGLADEFRAAGFPGETASMPWENFESRAITWTGSVDNINKNRYQAGAFPYDQRWAWPAFTRVPVDAGVTSVDVMTQTARSLATAANVVRAIDAVTAKPETGSTLTIVTTSLKQVATIQTNIPNVYLEQQAFNTVIENDLRLAINDGLDKLILDYIAASGFQAPGTDVLLVSIRKAMTTLFAAGYNPDTLLLTPAAAEALDVLVSGITGGTNDFVFAPANFAPDSIFRLNRRISKTIPASAVVDSTALGKLYASQVTLARFEADAGTTNRSNVRMELNGVFGGERQAAAVRIAAS
jgi:HK97 family phage prohead protease